MTTRDELDALSSRELHDLAVRRALHHVDVEFLWELLRAIPAAEAAEGHPAHAGMDINKVSGLLSDALTSGETDVADALRPLYLDYLTKHSPQELPVRRARRRQPGKAPRQLPSAAPPGSCRHCPRKGSLPRGCHNGAAPSQ